MGKQYAVDALRESIRLLEIRQAEEGKELKVQLRVTYESLKPVNLLKSTVKDITSSVELRSGLLESLVSILSGYVTQRMVVRSRGNVLLKLLATALQFGVAGFVANHVETIRSFVNQLFDSLRHNAESGTFTEKGTEERSE
jgi:hypothetical protein